MVGATSNVRLGCAQSLAETCSSGSPLGCAAARAGVTMGVTKATRVRSAVRRQRNVYVVIAPSPVRVKQRAVIKELLSTAPLGRLFVCLPSDPRPVAVVHDQLHVFHAVPSQRRRIKDAQSVSAAQRSPSELVLCSLRLPDELCIRTA